MHLNIIATVFHYRSVVINLPSPLLIYTYICSHCDTLKCALCVSAGAFCIPVYIPYILTGRWTLGRSLCKLWLVMDYLLCSASVFSIVLISYDRFLSVTRAVSAASCASHLWCTESHQSESRDVTQKNTKLSWCLCERNVFSCECKLVWGRCFFSVSLSLCFVIISQSKWSFQNVMLKSWRALPTAALQMFTACSLQLNFWLVSLPGHW